MSIVRTFSELGVTAIPVLADNGPIGGNLSHEFHILANTGESTLYYDPGLEQVAQNLENIRVELDPLSKEDLVKILREPESSLIKQLLY